MTEFEVLVKEMRDAQKEYFSTRSKDVLTKCKKLEKEVDDYLKKPSGKVSVGENSNLKQGSIFGG